MQCISSVPISKPTFKYLDGDGGLVVGGCWEDLRFLGWHHGVPGDESCHHASDGLDTHGQGVDVQQYEVTCIGQRWNEKVNMETNGSYDVQ